MGGVYAHTCMHTRKRVCVRRRSAHAYHSPPAHLIAPRPHPGVGTTLAPAPTLTLTLILTPHVTLVFFELPHLTLGFGGGLDELEEHHLQKAFEGSFPRSLAKSVDAHSLFDRFKSGELTDYDAAAAAGKAFLQDKGIGEVPCVMVNGVITTLTDNYEQEVMHALSAEHRRYMHIHAHTHTPTHMHAHVHAHAHPRTPTQARKVRARTHSAVPICVGQLVRLNRFDLTIPYRT